MSLNESTPIERAFELARSGRAGSMLELRQLMRAEGIENIDAHLTASPSMSR